MKLMKFNPKQLRFSPKRLFRSKDKSSVSRSDPSSFSSGTSSSSSSSSSSDGPDDNHKPGSVVATVGSVTPTSVLPEISGDFSEISADVSPDFYLELREAFRLMDKDNDGVVSREDLEALLSRLGPEPPSQEEVNMMLSEVDRDGRGWISLEALASRVVSAEGLSPVDLARDSTELHETFEFFDADHDGRISAEELLRVFRAIGDEQCTLDECRRMIAGVDKDGDGFVCLEEFARMMEPQS